VASVSALAVVSMALSACSSNSTSASSSPSAAASTSAPASAAAALTSAIVGLGGQAFDMRVTAAGATGTGSVDPSKRAVTFDAKGSEGGETFELNVTAIDTDLWVKLDLGSHNGQLGLNPAKWLKVDSSKIDFNSIGLDVLNSTDVLDLTSMQKAMSNVKRTDDTHLTGTIDLTALTGVVSPDSDDLTKAGAAAKAVPFSATLDGQGRLSELKINGDSIGTGLSIDIVITNIGAASSITAPPASDVVPAPGAIYQILGKN
jgi:hypothetical protein